jgi:putative hydrolase of the HAD superfamily
MARFVIFDLFHTLLHGADEERDRVVAEMAVIVGVEPAGLVRAYHDTWRERLVRWDVEETVRLLAEGIGGRPTDEQVRRAGARRRELANRLLGSVGPATLGVLDLLRAAGARLALVSNATAEAAETWPTCELAARFDAAVFSCELGVAKPDPAIFLAAVRRLGADPVECVYVADGADQELAAAAALGMTVIRTTEHNDTDPSWTGVTIAALAELPALLRVAAGPLTRQGQERACR